MNGCNCTDESSTSESISQSISPATMGPERFRRNMGSGTSSVVLDPEGGTEAESGRKLPSSKFKGVVPQPNGRWGAQIYEKHQRVWLGTFNHETDAALSYDVAALRFRGRDAVTNFKSQQQQQPNSDAGFELAFLSSHSKAEVVDMLRKHTYGDELEQSKRKYANGGALMAATDFRTSSADSGGSTRSSEQLFEKAVTPSDVGKLNRLVIPKQHAEKHFPLETGSAKGVLLNFEDATGKVWRFRYSYWNSSQSYVLTKGWSRFVKENGLRAGDIVGFHRSGAGPEKQLLIDWKPRSSGVVNPVQPPVQMVRLFGVNILKLPVQMGDANNKRPKGVGLRGDLLECCKKQRVIGAL